MLVNNAEHSRCPSTSKLDENVMQIKELLHANKHITVCVAWLMMCKSISDRTSEHMTHQGTVHALSGD
jgi:hypothetical protein